MGKLIYFIPNKNNVFNVLENGRPRYTEAQKEEVRQNILGMMDLIHKKDYFTIAKDVKKSKFRPYIMNFLRFRNEEDKYRAQNEA